MYRILIYVYIIFKFNILLRFYSGEPGLEGLAGQPGPKGEPGE